MRVKPGKKVISALASRYNQLYLTPSPGLSQSSAYADIVKKGLCPGSSLLARSEGPSGFTGSIQDRLFKVSTPVGKAEVIYLHHRSDFERFVRIMAYKGEDTAIPRTMGAVSLQGIVNWRKIERIKARFFERGGTPEGWAQRFAGLKDEKARYQDCLIAVSRGGYSGIDWTQTGYGEEEWERISFEIRVYHECVHFMCRKKYPSFIDPLWDELLADCAGITHAIGAYDANLASLFLGIGPEGDYRGGRLVTYFGLGEDMSAKAREASRIIEALDAEMSRAVGEDILVLASRIEAKRFGLS